FPFSIRNAARGVVDGTLIRDNGPATIPVSPASPTARPALTSTSRPRVGARALEVQAAPAVPRGGVPPGGVPPGAGLPVRIAGELTLSQAELMGAPVGGTISGGDFLDVPIFDIRIVLGRSVQIAVPNLHAEIIGDMSISGSPRDPLLVGTFDTRSGQVRFPNAQARITEGAVAVSARRDPVSGELRVRVEVDVTARSRVGRYDITLQMRGPLDTGTQIAQNLRIDVTSNPPLSQDEAFAQLLGTANLEDVLSGGKSNDTYARAIVNLFSAPVFSGIERSLERALGLTSVAFEYRLNEPLGVEFGKALGSRAYITYRRSIAGNQPGLPEPYSLSIEYRIKGDLQLGLQTDERQRRQITIEKTWRF
ncbi:MAG TPA: translocation/assembly module TamB domain-containing protein, partial [Abditibacteriaceae bacterium]|nr:translocation/assembly module TamB domain-containing protein [Abditibacteriaceae bacterium]